MILANRRAVQLNGWKSKLFKLDLYSQERIEQMLEQGFKEKVLEKLYQAADFFRYHVEWGRNDFGSAKYFSSIEDVIELLTGIDQLESKQLMERVERILLINDQSRGKGLTNANRPKDEHLIAFKEEYNAGKSQIISGLRDLGQEVYELTLLKDYQDQAVPLLILLRDFVLDFSVWFIWM